MRVAGHGLVIDAPQRWEARIFCRADAAPVLHAATFALRERDGDFGAAATGRMGADDVFAALIEYRADAMIRARVGLFSAAGRPAGLSVHDFGSGSASGHPRRAARMPAFLHRCRTAVLSVRGDPSGGQRPELLVKELNGVLATLEVEAWKWTCRLVVEVRPSASVTLSVTV